jgi:hypothetical protein
VSNYELFKKVEAMLDQLEDELPVIEEVNYRLRLMLLTIGGIVVGIIIGALSIVKFYT